MKKLYVHRVYTQSSPIELQYTWITFDREFMNFELVNSCYYIQECKTTQIRFLKQRFPPNNRVLCAIEYVTTSNIEEPYSIQQNCHTYQII